MTPTDKEHSKFIQKCRRQRQKLRDLLEYVDTEKENLFQETKKIRYDTCYKIQN